MKVEELKWRSERKTPTLESQLRLGMLRHYVSLITQVLVLMSEWVHSMHRGMDNPAPQTVVAQCIDEGKYKYSKTTNGGR
jgi:hypothetical protein